MARRRRISLALLALLVCIGALSLRYASRAAAETLPSRLTDSAFWQMVTDFSEPNGYFRSDNFLSNERGFQRVIPELDTSLPAGGVYVGVGPEQNFSYLTALRPKMAFVVDIRRGNLHEHLLYKAFIEMSQDRADFLSRLFARARPDGLAENASVEQLFAAYRAVPASEDLFMRNLQAAKDRLVKDHGFALSVEDLSGLEYVYDAFYEGGPDLTYTFMPGRFGGGGRFYGGFFPTYAELMTETDGQRRQRSYLATAENYRVLRELETNNAIVPLVGDFAGPKALRALGRYLSNHGATVTAFYTSNVEMYLFQTDAWKAFYANVASFPVDARSAFIRSVSNRGFQSAPGMRAATRLSSIADVLTAVRKGRVEGYYDIIRMSH